MEEKKRKGCFIDPDDLEVGQYIAVHKLNCLNHGRMPEERQASTRCFQAPFVVVQPVGSDDTATIDIRFLNVMRVSEAFVKAQTPQRPQEDVAEVHSQV